MIVVVGIGADGWDGLGSRAREAVLAADLLVGAERHLALVPPNDTERRAWPSPLTDLVDELAKIEGRRICVLASGDPMLHGVGATLVRRIGAERVRVHPHPSAHAIACARLGWPVADTELISAVGRPVEVLVPALQPGRRVVVFVSGPSGAAEVARVACSHGYGSSRLVVLSELGGPDEQIVESTAAGWGSRVVPALHVAALECELAAGSPLLPRTPGLPDDAYDSDGQLTKRETRAITLAALAPVPGQLLWDVGSGSGSIAIEWMRCEGSCRAIAVETRADRTARIAGNAQRLGVPGLEVVEGHAPQALQGLKAPDAIFVGGGLTEKGLLEACWTALAPGGRLVANAVTLEGEQVLVAAHAEHGGRLVRLAVAHAAPVGSFTAWRPALPLTQWSVRA
jgi:precorrin-6B C5,15-methyltransferase / cobalt-precorrin-6B C5,C15-methyltransferase